MFNLIPKPASLTTLTGDFNLSTKTQVYADSSTTEVQQLAEYAAKQLQLTTAGNSGLGIISLLLNNDSTLGDEGYELSVTADGIRISASRPAGLFYGIQTLLQMI